VSKPRFRSHGKEIPKTDESERAFSLILSASIGFHRFPKRFPQSSAFFGSLNSSRGILTVLTFKKCLTWAVLKHAPPVLSGLSLGFNAFGAGKAGCEERAGSNDDPADL